MSVPIKGGAQFELVRRALVRLAIQPNHMAVVILGSQRTGGFVQISGNREAGYILDVPYPALERSQRCRASSFISNLPLHLGSVEVSTWAYSFNLGHSIDAAAQLAESAVRAIFALDEAEQLALEERQFSVFASSLPSGSADSSELRMGRTDRKR